MNITPTITINNLINQLNHDPKLFEEISEFNFAVPLADKVRARKCQCGLGADFAAATQVFNQVAQNLSSETIDKLKKNFNTDKICFGVQTKFNFELKCY